MLNGPRNLIYYSSERPEEGFVFPESGFVQLPVSGPESDHLSGATESGSVDPAASRVERQAGELSLIGSAGIFP